jgi:hypothetical protein
VIKSLLGVLTGTVILASATAGPPSPTLGRCASASCHALAAVVLAVPAIAASPVPMDFVATNVAPSPEIVRTRNAMWIDIPTHEGVQRVLVTGNFRATVQRFVR